MWEQRRTFLPPVLGVWKVVRRGGMALLRVARLTRLIGAEAIPDATD